MASACICWAEEQSKVEASARLLLLRLESMLTMPTMPLAVNRRRRAPGR